MRYPQLKVQPTTRQMVDAFRGYNHNLRISDGEFFDMKNMTSDYYPVLSPRGKRGFYVKPASPQGLIAKDAICYVDGTEFVIGEYRIDMGLSVKAEDCPKHLVSMGAYVIIMPDKKYINTMDLTDFGSIEASFTSSTDVSFALCTVTGDEYSDTTISPDVPANPSNLDYWIDTSTTPNSLKQYSASTGTWVSIATTYVKISAAGIGKAFQQYDGVTISGIKDEALQDLNVCGTVADVTPLTQMTWLDNLWAAERGYDSKRILMDAFPQEDELDDEGNVIVPKCDTYLYIYGGSTSAWRHLPHYYEMRDMLGMYYMDQ